MPLPLLKYDEIRATRLGQLPLLIRGAATFRVGSLTLDDLAEVNDYPNGAYVFYAEECDKEPFYVGRASSRSFLGRIPSHFEQREDYWMNALSKGMHRTRKLSAYSEGVRMALRCQVAFIGVHLRGTDPLCLVRKRLINKLELVLQDVLQPELNKRNKVLDHEQTLEQALLTA